MSINLENAEIIEAAFNFWFKDHEHIRSPFPKYIHGVLREQSLPKFELWLKNLNPQGKDEIHEEILAEKLEEIIFETALSLVKTEDERISILYPFMPRIGDATTNSGEESLIAERRIEKKGDLQYLVLTLIDKEKKKQISKIELPA